MLLIHGVVVWGYLHTCRKAHFLSIAISHQRKNSKYVELAEMKNNTKLFFQNKIMVFSTIMTTRQPCFFIKLINQKILPSLEEIEKPRFARHFVVLTRIQSCEQSCQKLKLPVFSVADSGIKCSPESRIFWCPENPENLDIILDTRNPGSATLLVCSKRKTLQKN